MTANYPIIVAFENSGYVNPFFLRGLRPQVSSNLKKKDYWICAKGNSSLKPQMHIYYFKNRGLLDSTLVSVCLIFQKPIQ